MFDKQYRFKGRHALEVEKLSAIFESENKTKVFARNIDIFIYAPLVGFLYGRMADVDDQKDSNGQVYDTSVFGEQVVGYSKELMFSFSMIMLLDEQYENDVDKRVDKAFRYPGQDPKDMERFDSYVRGGVDVLYEKIIENARDPEDYVNNLYDFVREFQERFNSDVSVNSIIEMCRK